MNDFISFFESVLGSYTPVLNPDFTVAAGMAGLDYPYIFRAVFLAIVVYSVLKCVGGMICKMY